VVDPAGNPVPAPHIALVSSARGCVPDGTQPAETPIPTAPGTHTVRVWADGFREATTSVTVDAGPGTEVKVVLEPSRAVVTEKQIVITTPVFFDYNQASIRPESYAVLDDVLYILQAHPEIRSVEVAGHTDADGSDSYNQALSQKRVESVRAYLVQHGIAPERLVARGYGESRPIDSNSTEAGKARNRRVEFNITDRGTP
jgi:outer membrane protein OmpA-like peptidoglycan-associated protein